MGDAHVLAAVRVREAAVEHDAARAVAVAAVYACARLQMHASGAQEVLPVHAPSAPPAHTEWGMLASHVEPRADGDVPEDAHRSSGKGQNRLCASALAGASVGTYLGVVYRGMWGAGVGRWRADRSALEGGMGRLWVERSVMRCVTALCVGTWGSHGYL